MSGQVNILLSTYNGRRYLPQLLDSLLTQTYTDIVINIRDDASTDGTYPFLSAWAEGRSNIHTFRGERLGATNSFFHLLQNAQPDCDYLAFCDQDDVWRPEKIQNALSVLKKGEANQPLLYCSRLEYVDSSLGHLGYSPVPRRLTFSNSLVENTVTGCTMVLNRPARTIVIERLPRYALMYDAWCYIVISAFGQILFDPRPTVQYRQHQNNLIGGSADGSQIWARRIRRALDGNAKNMGFLAQAMEFYELFSRQLKIEDLRTLEDFLASSKSFLRRAVYAGRMEVRRQSWSDDLVLRALVLMGRV